MSDPTLQEIIEVEDGSNLTEKRFREFYGYQRVKGSKFILKEKLRKFFVPTKRCLFNFFPILEWLPRYQKSCFFRDLIAGLTIGTMQIPQGENIAIFLTRKCMNSDAKIEVLPEIGRESTY